MLQLLKQPATRAGIVLGVGLGGFLDGIILHQILGWHHLICLTETCEPESVQSLQRQNIQDGFFHLGTWLTTVTGVALLWRARALDGPSTSGHSLLAATLAGWGLFNLVEGLINHQLLGLHHVRPASPHWAIYDLLFLALGAALIGFGEWWLRGSLKRR